VSGGSAFYVAVYSVFYFFTKVGKFRYVLMTRILCKLLSVFRALNVSRRVKIHVKTLRVRLLGCVKMLVVFIAFVH
jgi:hypothetical protein